MADRGTPCSESWSTEAILTAIVQSADDAIVSKDLDGIVMSWNPAAERIFGYTAAEMIGQPILKVIPPDRVHEEPVILARIRRGERIDHYQTVRLRKDGRRIDVSVTISPVRDAEGRIVGASKIARDVTEEMNLAAELQARTEQVQQQNEELELQNEELELQNLELEEADRQKNQFLAMLAHELRNPLAPIVNAMHLLKARGYDDPFLLKNHDVIARQVRHMSRLLEDLLEVSRVTRGMVTLRFDTVDLAEIVHGVIHSLEDYAAEKGHTLNVDLPFVAMPVHGDTTRLHQVVSNLLNNAVKFTDPGGAITVALRRDGTHAELRVRDTGAGMSPELLPRVFDLFTQEDQGLARVKGGLGVGLTIVRNLVEMHGGTVEARSRGLGRGSEFIVRLPLVPDAEEREEPPAASAGASDPAAEAPAPEAASVPADPVAVEEPASTAPRPLRVLLIDDNLDTATTLGEILEAWGYDARVATSGPRGLEMQATFQADVILLDLGMPGMDGFEVAARLLDSGQWSVVSGQSDMRDPTTTHHSPLTTPQSPTPPHPRTRAPAHPHTHTPTLVALTGYGLEEDRRRTRAAGFQHHLTKPVDPNLLRDLLEKLRG